MKDIVIIGARAHGRICADIAAACGRNVLGYLSDGIEKGEMRGDLPVLGKIADCVNYPDCEFVLAKGTIEIRRHIAGKYDLDWATLIHPSAVISPSAKIGRGSIIMPLAVINAEAQIGEFTIVKSGSVIEYKNRIGSFCNIAPNSVCGACTVIGDGTQISIGATVRNNINICDDVIVGAGAVVIRDIRESGAYVGVPAKKIGG